MLHCQLLSTLVWRRCLGCRWPAGLRQLIHHMAALL